MNIVILDGYTENPGDLSWDGFRAYGDVTVYDRTPFDEQEIIRRIGDAEIVYTNKTPLSRAVIEACPSVRFIGALSTGYNVIDIAAAKEKGIPVSNVPAYGTDAVGQFAIALLLEICSKVGHHDEAVHEGRWAANPDFCFWDGSLIELAGKTMGILGYGRIGKKTGTIAKALGMRVIANSRSRYEGSDEIAEFVDVDTLLRTSDVIALHCPLFPETTGIICKENIDKMKDGVIIINNSRGPLVVEQDLADALNSGKVYAAGLDVVSTEPIREDNPLLKAKNCIITPHISWAPIEARGRIMDTSVENLKAFLEGSPIHVVNA